MSCGITPEQSCGTIYPAACVSVEIELLDCFEYNGPCIKRQSQLNELFQLTFCSILSKITALEEAIDLSEVSSECSTPDTTSIAAAITQLWTYICNTRGITMSIGDVDVKCLEDSCGEPIDRLDALLQAIIDKQCSSGIYRANLTQTSTNAPVATVFENTIGSIVWTRTGIGTYVGTLAGAFTVGKTFLVIGNTPGTVTTIESTSVNAVQVTTTADAELNNTSIEIRVYP